VPTLVSLVTMVVPLHVTGRGAEDVFVVTHHRVRVVRVAGAAVLVAGVGGQEVSCLDARVVSVVHTFSDASHINHTCYIHTRIISADVGSPLLSMTSSRRRLCSRLERPVGFGA
jgi:ABC-type thiamin/hydroxymethylpyrimidine transport system permease subunit